MTVADARAVQPEWLERWLGPRRGEWLHRRLHGIDRSRVDPHQHRKSISSERTFFEDLDRMEDLDHRLLELATSVGSTLRKMGIRARTITVKLSETMTSTPANTAAPSPSLWSRTRRSSR